MATKEILHIYTRVSTDAQEEKGTSLESQRELGIEAAKKLKFQHKVWNEGGASSFYEDFSNRPVLLELLRKIEAGEVKHLWVYNNDRLSRNDATAHTIRSALKKHNVVLYTKDGRFDLNNPQDNLMKSILDSMAAFDNAMRADRTRLGKLNRVKQGYWMGGPPPFGYVVKDRKLALHPNDSKWVQKIYEWYGDGKSIQWIKSELDKSGVKTNRGRNTWSLGSINKILQNPHPLGSYSYRDSKTDETVECSCPPIVSKSLWSACQKQRKKILERKGQNNRTQRFYLLRNLMYCGHCGSPMSARIKEVKSEYLYYCPRKERDWKNSPPPKDQKWTRDRGCSMTKSLNIPMTDQFVWSNVMLDMLRSKYVQKGIKDLTKRGNVQDSPELALKKQRNSLLRLQKEKAKLIEDIAAVETAKILGQKDKAIADQVLKNLNQVLIEQEALIEQIEFQIADIQKSSAMHSQTMRSVNIGYKTAIANIDMTTDAEERKERLERILEKIVVFYDKDQNEHELKFFFKIPVLQAYEGTKEKGGKMPLKKTKKLKGNVTPLVDNKMTVE